MKTDAEEFSFTQNDESLSFIQNDIDQSFPNINEKVQSLEKELSSTKEDVVLLYKRQNQHGHWKLAEN